MLESTKKPAALLALTLGVLGAFSARSNPGISPEAFIAFTFLGAYLFLGAAALAADLTMSAQSTRGPTPAS